MVSPGWYPDPSGAPGQLRWWNGTAWTADVHPIAADGRTGPDAPGTPAAPLTHLESASPTGPGSRTQVLIGGVAVLVLALVLGWWFLLRPTLGTAPVPPGPPATGTPTVTGWNELDPSPSVSGSASASGSPTPFDCTPILGDRRPHPEDGQQHGGGLRVPVAEGFQPTPVRFFRWAEDESAATKAAGGGWQSFTGVGAVPSARFGDPERASMLLWECHTVAGSFSGRTYADELASEAVTIDGRPGWWRRVEVGSTAAPGGGARFDFVVVDVGDPDRLGFYWAGVTLNDTDALASTDAARRSLRVDG